MKAPRIKRRGRKTDDGILKEIDPRGSALDSAMKFAYGRRADDHFSEMVRTWRAIHRACEDLARRETMIGEGRIAAAQLVEASKEEIGSGKMDKDVEAIRYHEDKRRVTSWFNVEMSRLTLQVRVNMQLGKAGWFRKVAEAIEAEVTIDGQDTYPLHAAVLRLFGQLRYTTNKDGVRCYSTGAPLDAIPRYTIGQACKILEDLGQRPAGQTNEDWKRTVRRACKDVGVTLSKSKSGPKPEKG